VLLRPLLSVLLLPLKWVFRLTSQRHRERIGRIPGVLAMYHSVLRILLGRAIGKGLVAAKVRGLTMLLAPERAAGFIGALLSGQYEPATSFVFAQALTEGDIAIDVGAHWGYYTLLAAALCGNRGRVFSFEPHPRNYALLARNIEANYLTNVVAVKKAVCNRAGPSQLVPSQGTGAHRLSPLRTEGGLPVTSPQHALTVDTVTLDGFLQAVGVGSEVRLVKMDIEGAEPLALAGMRGLIEGNPSLVLIAEFSPIYMDAQAAADFLDSLAAGGFRLGIIDDDRRQLTVGPKALLLKRFLDDRAAYNLLATRDRSFFERLFHQPNGLGKHLGHMEGVSL
jgi:FkbM family methyltransferase